MSIGNTIDVSKLREARRLWDEHRFNSSVQPEGAYRDKARAIAKRICRDGEQTLKYAGTAGYTHTFAKDWAHYDLR